MAGMRSPACCGPMNPTRAARDNLRQTLTNLRQVIGDRAATPPFLEKSTYVRVYPAVDLADTPHVTMVLHAYVSSGAFELPGSPVQPLWPELKVQKSGAHRERLADSFLFYLPLSWRAARSSCGPRSTPAG